MAARFTRAFFVMSRIETRSKPCSLNNSSAVSRMRERVPFNSFIRSFQTIVFTWLRVNSFLSFVGILKQRERSRSEETENGAFPHSLSRPSAHDYRAAPTAAEHEYLCSCWRA